MIYDSYNNTTTGINLEAVAPSPYEIGLEGAMMHVYENECNFNAMMKSIGISELRYFKETGGDLYVQEAGATGGMFDKFIAFFKAVKEKIIQMIKKFFMKINSLIASDKKFVDKYRKEVFKNFKQFKFTGWKFEISDPIPADLGMFKGIEIVFGKDLDPEVVANTQSTAKLTDEDCERIVNKYRSDLVGEKVEGSQEFREVAHKSIYGEEKEEIEVTASYCAQCFEYISSAEKNTKTVNKAGNAATKALDKYISKLEKARNILAKRMTDKDYKDSENNDTRSDRINNINQSIVCAKDVSSVLTESMGLITGAIKDCNRQCKAICVKALNSGSKKSTEESAMYESNTDVFADVQII